MDDLNKAFEAFTANLKEKADTIRLKANLAAKDARSEVEHLEGKLAIVKRQLEGKWDSASRDAVSEWEKLEERVKTFKHDLEEKGEEAKNDWSARFDRFSTEVKDNVESVKTKLFK